jgi:hypothetical protein
MHTCDQVICGCSFKFIYIYIYKLEGWLLAFKKNNNNLQIKVVRVENMDTKAFHIT